MAAQCRRLRPRGCSRTARNGLRSTIEMISAIDPTLTTKYPNIATTAATHAIGCVAEGARNEWKITSATVIDTRNWPTL